MWRTPFSPQASALKPLASKLGQHFLADGAVQHRTGMGLVAEQEGDVQNTRLGHKVGHRAGGGERELLGAELHRFNGLALATERAGIERLDLVAAVGALFDLFGKGVDTHALVRVLGHRNADLHGGLGGGRGHKTDGQRSGQNQAGKFHGLSPVGEKQAGHFARGNAKLSYNFASENPDAQGPGCCVNRGARGGDGRRGMSVEIRRWNCYDFDSGSRTIGKGWRVIWHGKLPLKTTLMKETP
jgi:hypothetical protein